jgi:crotonobetainyl-CoA:carnitine CoA-transferase CaiB-like acyl-CoA transferase
MNIPLATSMASGRETGKSGSETPMLAPYRAFRASDRYIVIAAGNDNLFRRMCTAVDKPEWATDPRFITNADRVNNRILINGLLDEVIVTRPEQYWTEKLTAVGVPCAPLQTTAEVIAHAQTRALGMLKPVGDSEMDLVGSPLSFNGVRPRIRSLAPTLGADTHRALDLIGSRRRWKDL